MTALFYKRISLPALLATLVVSTSLWAQDGAEADPDEAAANAKNEKIEATSDLRESIHENLESLQENKIAIVELEEAQREQLPPGDQEAAEASDEKATASTESSSDSSEQVSGDQQVTQKSFLDYIKAVPGQLQSVPEKVPFFRERGLIFFGRMELDFAYYSSGTLSDDTGFRVRSLRVGLAKAFKHNLSMKAEVDLTDGESNFADLYLRHVHKRWGMLTVGNQRVAQTLVNQTSRISQTFMEEPLPAEAFGLGRRLALGWDLNKKKGGLHLTAFGSDLNGSIGDSGFAGRIYLNPTRSRFSVFHVGASVVSENMSRKTRFYSHPESRVTSQRLVDTGIYEDITNQGIAALEIAGSKGSLMFHAEYFRAWWDQPNAKDPVFKGFYALASWVLTGEKFSYTEGKFLRVRPQSPRGAWEVAARFSAVDLNDEAVTGGAERNLTIGVNWYAPRNQFRVMSNPIFVRTDENADDENTTIFQLRGQLHW
jgi:phosphate-selective porin OprO/OprP